MRGLLVAPNAIGRPVVAFRRVDGDDGQEMAHYLVGPSGREAIFEPTRTTAMAAAALHRVASRRGARHDVHDLHTLRDSRATCNPRKSIQSRLMRMAREIEATSPELGAALAGVRTVVIDGRVKAWIPDRTNAFAIDTADPKNAPFMRPRIEIQASEESIEAS